MDFLEIVHDFMFRSSLWVINEQKLRENHLTLECFKILLKCFKVNIYPTKYFVFADSPYKEDTLIYWPIVCHCNERKFLVRIMVTDYIIYREYNIDIFERFLVKRPVVEFWSDRLVDRWPVGPACLPEPARLIPLFHLF